MLTQYSSAMHRQSARPLVLGLIEVDKEEVSIVGGKGASLGELIRAGIPVPPGFVVTTEAYREFMMRNRLNEVVDGLLSKVDLNDTRALHLAASQIQQVILTSLFPTAVHKAVYEGYWGIKEGPVAVRSSATAEDLPQASFAGQQKTFLWVEGLHNVLQAIQACWASLFEARAIFYRATNGLEHDNVSIAVAIQGMVDPDVAGLTFTTDPSNGNRDTLLMEAAYGLVEPLVSGELSSDSYVVDRATLAVRHRQLAEQTWQLRRNGADNGYGHATARQQVSAPLQGRQKLTEEQIGTLARLCLRLEAHFGQPQDVEWALADGRFSILQSRPITTLKTSNVSTPAANGSRPAVLSGAPASPGVAAGRVRIIHSPEQLHLVQKGDILVTKMTTADYVLAMKRAAAIITDRSGRTCHAATVSREMGVPCIVGTGNATEVLSEDLLVTADGAVGKVYQSDLVAELISDRPARNGHERLATRTKLYVNLADAEAAERVAALNVDGVGVLRAES